MRLKAEVPTVRTAVRDVMRSDVITVRDGMTLQEVAAFLVENQISGAPVEDGDGRLIGVLSYADIARAASELPQLEAARGEPELPLRYFARSWEEPLEAETLAEPPVSVSGLFVRDIMTPEIFAVDQEAPVAEAARMMLDAHIHRLLVTHGHKVVGILTTSDLLELLVEKV